MSTGDDGLTADNRPSRQRDVASTTVGLLGWLRALMERASGVAVFGVIILVFSLWVPQYFDTTTTLQTIAGGQAITLILSLGVLFTLAAGEFDLSMAQNLGLAAVMVGSLMLSSHVSPVLAVLLTLGAGFGVGAVNGFLVAFVGVNSFITTLGMGSVLLAVTEIISGDNYIGPVSASFQSIGNSQPLGIPIVVFYAAAIALVAWYVLEHSPIGRWIQAVGANREAAHLAGVPTRRLIFLTFVISGVFSSLAGILVTAKIGEVSPSLGPPYLLPAFTACFLGATQLKPGRFNVWGTVLAIYLLATGVTGLELVGGPLWVTDMFNGVALVGAVTVAVVVQKRRAARLRAAADRDTI
jgi:ribose transport system permease protein